VLEDIKSLHNEVERIKTELKASEADKQEFANAMPLLVRRAVSLQALGLCPRLLRPTGRFLVGWQGLSTYELMGWPWHEGSCLLSRGREGHCPGSIL
jgi:hypothetical protein